MANPATINRDLEQLDEEQEHGRQISDNYRKLVEPNQTDTAPWAENYAYNTSAYQSGMVNPSVRMYGTADEVREPTPRYRYRESNAPVEYHEPVVPTSPEAPSAAQRLNDYVPIRHGMQSLTKMGDMQSGQAYAASAPAPAQEGKRMLFEGLTYQNGELIDMNAPVAPTIDSSYMAEDVMDGIAYGEPTPEGDDDEDARPTGLTLETLKRKTETNMVVETPPRTNFFSSLSTNAKIALITVAAVIVVMIALICVNTAVLGALKSTVSDRQEQVQLLEQQANDIKNEIEEITSPENIDSWAISHGLVPQA